jgi:putative endonuclease
MKTGIELYLPQAGIELYPPSQLMAKFYYVYILHNKQKNFIYIGYSENLKQRVEDHNKGRSTSTKKYTPLKLIHYEAYCDKIDAKRRERYLKTNRGKTTLKTMLQNHFKK